MQHRYAGLLNGPGPDYSHPATRFGYIFRYVTPDANVTLETAVLDSNRSVEHMRRLRERYGPRTAVWRYAAASEVGFEWRDPTDDEKQHLATELALMAQARGMQLVLCGQRHLLVPGVVDASCIDSGRLAGVAGRAIVAEKRGSRRECGCHASKDIGDYDTCPHGCVYCYAVQNRELALARHEQHDRRRRVSLPSR